LNLAPPALPIGARYKAAVARAPEARDGRDAKAGPPAAAARAARQLAAEQTRVPHQGIGLPSVGQPDVAQQVPGAALQGHQLARLSRSAQLRPQSTEPRWSWRIAWPNVRNFNHLSHDRDLFHSLLRPNLAYVSAMNLRSTWPPFKPILRGRA
jgi:hypothetical protein